jgi:excisionase family DNA binding protein
MADSPKRSTAGSSDIESRQLTLEDWFQMLEEDATRLHKSPDQAPEHSPAPSEAQLVSAGVALLTTREVADALHVHPRTVQRLVERGELAAVRLGAAIRFDPAELVRLIAERTRIAQPSGPPADTLRARPTGVSFAKRLRSQPA